MEDHFQQNHDTRRMKQSARPHTAVKLVRAGKYLFVLSIIPSFGIIVKDKDEGRDSNRGDSYDKNDGVRVE